MTDRNNAPAGRLVPEVRVPTEKELREQNHPERDGKPMLLSSKWMVKAGLAMCDELLAVCKQLVHDLDETDHEDVYLAMDVKSKTEWCCRSRKNRRSDKSHEKDSHKGKGLGRAAAARVPDPGRVRRTDRRVPQDGAAHVPDGNAARH